MATNNQPLVVIMEDDIIHSDETPFCSDSTCPCHFARRRKYELVASPWYDGLLTASESQRLFSGEQLAAYRCTCPLSPVRCSNPVGAQGGLCGPCSTGDHSGHWRAPRQEVGA